MSSTNVSYFKVPASHAVAFLKTSWELAKRNYSVVFTVGIVHAVIVLMVSKVPVIGATLSPVASVFLSAGLLVVARKLVHGEQAQFSDLFVAFSDAGLTKKLIPFGVLMAVFGMVAGFVSAVIAGATAFSSMSMMNPEGGNFMAMGMAYVGLMFSALMMSLIIYLTWFVVPLILFKNLGTKEAINDSVAATLKGWWPLAVVGLACGVYAMISAMLLVLPLVFIYLPGIVCLQYLLYSAFFEGRNVKEYLERLKTTPALQPSQAPGQTSPVVPSETN